MLLMGKSTISVVIFHVFLYVYQRVIRLSQIDAPIVWISFISKHCSAQITGCRGSLLKISSQITLTVVFALLRRIQIEWILMDFGALKSIQVETT